MSKKMTRQLLSIGLAAVLSVSVLPMHAGITASADEQPSTVATSTVSNSYNAYAEKNADFAPAEGEIALSADTAAVSGSIALKDVSGKKAIVWENSKDSAVWQVTVPKDGYYNLKLVYSSIDSGVDYSFGVLIDGSAPFEEAGELIFNRLWVNSQDEFREDTLGNQLTPEQVELEGYCEMLAHSSTGVTVEPYAFYLTAGTHTLSLVGPGQSVAVASVVLTVPEQAPKYSDLAAEYPEDLSTNAETIVIQGENAVLKTSSMLIPKSDNADAGMTPKDPLYTKLNYIGGTSWQDAGQYLTWNFNVETAGYYTLGFRYRQSDVINAESWRWLKIDGETPFEEAKGMRFAYSSRWDFYEYSYDEDSPYYFYLDAGPHTITLEVTMGAMSEYFYRLSEVVEILADRYIDIVKITGATPDLNLDYELFSQIPNLNSSFEECRDKLTSLVEDLQDFTGARSSQYIAAMNNMVRVLDNMIENPYIAHQYVKDYYTNYTSLSSWLYDMRAMPLNIDTIQFAPVGGEYVDKDANLFQKMGYTIQRLFISFFDDYIIEKERGDDETASLTLWVNWGRDQASALDTLIRDSFTEQTGIPVNVKITNASLVNGLLSGNFPDMSLHLARTEPVNLGIRGALTDLRQFDDIESVLERFQPGAETPYGYNGELYALPDTQGFFMMFYRTDILESLGLTVPTTWDEFLYTSAIIQRNNMNVYVPYTQITASTTINAGIGSLNLFATLMGQNGLSLYNEELNATDLTSIEAINVFDEWTELYTDYDYDKESDFYNRFRSGIMPLGISTSGTYLSLYSAAPEIKGRWSIACLPGTEGGNNTVAGSGTGCAILKKSPNQEEAWEFLKWWTSAEAQTRYSNNVESILGMLGRQSTANVEALSNLAWESEHLSVILEQWSRVKEVPEVPGSYYLGRSLDQAFWYVINDGVNAKDSIVKWSQVADAEIARKIKQYS